MSLHPARLRLLVQLESLGTVRAVAEAVGQSASSVSQQLSVLQAESGVTLLERSGRRVRLTTAGHVLAARSREVLDLLAAAQSEIRVLDEEPAGVVQVAAFQSAIHALVVPAAASLQERHPRLLVHVDEREPHESTAALLRGDADVVVTTSDFLAVPRHGDVRVVPLATDPLVVVAPRGHRIEHEVDVELSTLADENWVFDMPGSYMSDLTTRWCRRAGFEPRVVCRFNNYLLTLRHVETTGTVAVLPALTLDPRHDVVAREVAPRSRRQITAAVRSAASARPAVDVVLEALRRGAGERELSRP